MHWPSPSPITYPFSSRVPLTTCLQLAKMSLFTLGAVTFQLTELAFTHTRTIRATVEHLPSNGQWLVTVNFVQVLRGCQYDALTTKPIETSQTVSSNGSRLIRAWLQVHLIFAVVTLYLGTSIARWFLMLLILCIAYGMVADILATKPIGTFSKVTGGSWDCHCPAECWPKQSLCILAPSAPPLKTLLRTVMGLSVIQE